MTKDYVYSTQQNGKPAHEYEPNFRLKSRTFKVKLSYIIQSSHIFSRLVI